jgi:catalase
MATKVFDHLTLGNKKNYHPNSFKTFAFNEDARYTPYRVTGLVGRHRANHPNSDFQQPGDLFRNVMNETERNNTIKNVAFHMKTVPREIQERATKNFYKADPEFGDGIAKMLGFSSVKSRL